jgi:hypothetical protein
MGFESNEKVCVDGCFILKEFEKAIKTTIPQGMEDHKRGASLRKLFL